MRLFDARLWCVECKEESAKHYIDMWVMGFFVFVFISGKAIIAGTPPWERVTTVAKALFFCAYMIMPCSRRENNYLGIWTGNLEIPLPLTSV